MPGLHHPERLGRRAEPARRGDRGARGRADGVAADARRRERDGGPDRPAARREPPRLGAAAAGPARAGDARAAGRGGRRGRRGAARAAAGARGRGRPRDAARDRAPVARRDLRRRRRRGGARRARHRDHAPGLPVPGSVDRGPDRAGAQGRAARALLRDLPHREGAVGADARGHPGDGGGEQRAVDRPRTAQEPAGRGRPAAHGGPHARGRVQRGRGADRDRDEHPACGRAGGAWRERADDGGRARMPPTSCGGPAASSR